MFLRGTYHRFLNKSRLTGSDAVRIRKSKAMVLEAFRGFGREKGVGWSYKLRNHCTIDWLQERNVFLHLSCLVISVNGYLLVVRLREKSPSCVRMSSHNSNHRRGRKRRVVFCSCAEVGQWQWQVMLQCHMWSEYPFGWLILLQAILVWISISVKWSTQQLLLPLGHRRCRWGWLTVAFGDSHKYSLITCIERFDVFKLTASDNIGSWKLRDCRPIFFIFNSSTKKRKMQTDTSDSRCIEYVTHDMRGEGISASAVISMDYVERFLKQTRLIHTCTCFHWCSLTILNHISVVEKECYICKHCSSMTKSGKSMRWAHHYCMWLSPPRVLYNKHDFFIAVVCPWPAIYFCSRFVVVSHSRDDRCRRICEGVSSRTSEDNAIGGHQSDGQAQGTALAFFQTTSSMYQVKV